MKLRTLGAVLMLLTVVGLLSTLWQSWSTPETAALVEGAPHEAVALDLASRPSSSSASLPAPERRAESRPDLVVTGCCVQRDGAPLAGVTVSAHAEGSADFQVATTTAQDGGFRLVVPRRWEGVHYLECRLPGWTPRERVLDEGVRRLLALDLGNVRLAPAGNVSGVVLDATRVGIPRAAVRLSRIEGFGDRFGAIRSAVLVSADDRGAFTVPEPLAVDIWHVEVPWVGAKSWAPGTLTVVPGESRLEIVCGERSPMIGGRVRLEGSELVGVTIKVESMTTGKECGRASAGADGGFLCERSALDPGPLRLKVHRLDAELLVVSDLHWGMRDVDLAIPEPASVELTVLDPHGLPAVGPALCFASTEEGLEAPTAAIPVTLDAAGHGVAQRVPSTTRFVRVLLLPAHEASRPVPVACAPGLRVAASVRLEGDLALAVHVRNSAGEPLFALDVDVADITQRDAPRKITFNGRTLRTDTNGDAVLFIVPELASGSLWVVSCQTTTGAILRREVPARTAAVDLVEEPAAYVEFELPNAWRSTLARSMVKVAEGPPSARDFGASLVGSACKVGDLPAGAYEIHARSQTTGLRTSRSGKLLLNGWSDLRRLGEVMVKGGSASVRWAFERTPRRCVLETGITLDDPGSFSLELRDAANDELLATAFSADGTFEFAALWVGSYRWKLTGTIPGAARPGPWTGLVEVSPAGPDTIRIEVPK